MGINQQQIAEALNLSVMTVSRALRHHPDLAENTRELVMKKAEELGYRKHLKKREANAERKAPETLRRMGIILFEDEAMGHFNLFKSGVIRRIFLSLQKGCQELGFETVLETPSADKPGDVPLLVKNRSVDGIFLLGRYSSNIVERLEGIPALAVSNFLECAGLPRVVADNFHGMREATEHLIGLGHRRILFLGDNQAHTQIFQERSFGYLAAMQTNGYKPTLEFMGSRREEVPVQKILKHTAVVCSNDNLGYIVKARLRAEGLKLPEDCSLVAFDNISALHESDPITSYEPDWEMMGQIAADLLVSSPQAIINRNVAVTVPGKMVMLDSTCPPPAE